MKIKASELGELREYTANNILQTQFYQYPKWLMGVDINNDAKNLYMLLKDRTDLSIANKWIDKEGKVFVIYTRKSVCDMLGIKQTKCTEIFAELKEAGLIREKKRGKGIANLIYVRYPSELYKVSHEKRKSRVTKNNSPESRKTKGNDTDFNDTYKSDNVVVDGEKNTLIFLKIADTIEKYLIPFRHEFSIYPDEEINTYINEFKSFVLNQDEEISNAVLNCNDGNLLEILIDYIKIQLKDPSMDNLKRPIGYIISKIKKGGK